VWRISRSAALGSSTLHLAYVAIGLIDGVVEHNNKIWDIAAACALVDEAGAEIHYLNGSPYPMKEVYAQIRPGPIRDRQQGDVRQAARDTSDVSVPLLSALFGNRIYAEVRAG